MAQPTFSLRVNTGDLDEAIVVHFTGSESISGLYTYDVTVKIPESTAIDLDAVLNADATFTILHDDVAYRRHGILQNFEMQHTAGGYTFFAASLVPHVWRLTTFPTNEVFVGPDFNDVTKIIDSVLSNEGFASGAGNDYDLSGLSATYPERRYTCQFSETDFHFISRLMERDGIWYHFEQGEEKETLVLGDHADYPALDVEDVVYSVAPDDANRYHSIQSWVCRKQRLPHEVVLRDYNYEQPSLDVSGTAVVDADGQGSVFVYGENFDDAEEGERLATVRAQELSCRKTVFTGEGAVPAFTAGYTFTLTGHNGNGGAWNDRDYLLLSIMHEGENLDNAVGAAKDAPRYRNTFTAIPAEAQFRPQRVTPKPRFDGTMTAMVYAENAAATLAEVDEYGCYRVRLPFDREGADGEKASHWIRMAQPYVGVEQGMYFPLKANTEVLLTFINGDPDRPIIAGAVPNAANTSLLRSDTSHQSIIQTADLLKLEAGGGRYLNVATAKFFKDENENKTATSHYEPAFNELNGDGTLKKAMTPEDELSGDFVVDRHYGDQYSYTEGTNFDWANTADFAFGCVYEETHEQTKYVGDKTVSTAKTRYGVSHLASPEIDERPDDEVFTIPVLGKAREKGEGLVEKSWGNNYSYHWGTSWEWSGGPGVPDGGVDNVGPVYSYGSSYAENLLRLTTGSAAANYASTKHQAWKNNATLSGSDGIAIEKTFGDTFDYHNGYAYEIHEGNSKSETYGDSDEYVKGDSKSEVHGNADDTVHGDSTEMVYGNVKGIVHGRTNDMVMGGANDMFLGGKNEMTVAAINNMALSIENNIWLGLKTDIEIGGVLEITGGGKIELALGASVEADSVAELRTKVTQIDTALTKLETVATDIKTKATEIKNGAMSLNLSALKFW